MKRRIFPTRYHLLRKQRIGEYGLRGHVPALATRWRVGRASASDGAAKAESCLRSPKPIGLWTATCNSARRKTKKFALRICFLIFVLLALNTSSRAAAPTVSLSSSGSLTISNTFTNGVCIVDHAGALGNSWAPAKNAFTTSTVAEVSFGLDGAAGFFRAQALDLSGGRVGFTNLTRAYGLLNTIAGTGGPPEVNNWRPEYEGALATTVVLSGPHITVADKAGNYYIADKDAHGIRKIRLDGTIITVAGTSVVGGPGPDGPTPATQVPLNGPNGLWMKPDGTCYILDTGNGKVRRLDTNGMLQTLFTSPSGIFIGRGLWVKDDETLAYFCSGTVVKRWTPSQGVTDFSTGYSQLGNLVVDGAGRVIVTDRVANRVYRLDGNGVRTPIAGTGGTLGAVDGALALNTPLEEVRAVWLMPNGGMFLATHRGSQVWYMDPSGFIHLFLHGNRFEVHQGDGNWFYNPLEPRVSEIRAVTMDFEGNILVTENDLGYVRKVRFLPFTP